LLLTAVLLSAVLQLRHCCWVPATVDRYLLPERRPAANPPYAAAVIDN